MNQQALHHLYGMPILMLMSHTKIFQHTKLFKKLTIVNIILIHALSPTLTLAPRAIKLQASFVCPLPAAHTNAVI